jgi:hypothetical protein
MGLFTFSDLFNFDFCFIPHCSLSLNPSSSFFLGLLPHCVAIHGSLRVFELSRIE